MLVMAWALALMGTGEPAPSIQTQADAYMAQKGVGSLSIAITRSGKDYCYAVGKAAGVEPAGPATIYEIGSITKTFTGLLLAQTVTAGPWRLDDDVSDRLGGDYANLAFDGHPVRLVHLTSMTSGLPDSLPARPAEEAGTPRDRAFARARQLESYSEEAFLADLGAVALTSEPGSSPGHSNVAAELLGLLLEREHGSGFGDLLKQQVEVPAGIAGPASTDVTAESLNLQGETMPYLTAASARASGGLRYNAADMLRYAHLQLQEDDPAVRLSHEPQWKTLDQKLGIAFGWIWHAESPAGRRLRTSGGSFGFASFIDLYPDSETAIVLMTNGADDPTQGELQTLSETFVETISTTAENTWAAGLGTCA